MWIESLTIRNFRGFEDVTLDLDRPLTVLAGINGSGKTSVLDATICLVSAALLRPLRNADRELELVRDEDTRIGSTRTELSANVRVEDRVVRWSVERQFGSPPRNTIPDRLVGGLPPLLPTVIYYPATRSVARAFDAFQPVANDGDPRGPLYRDWLTAPRTGFASFFRWFKEREDVENEEKVSLADLAHEDPHLSAIRRAVASMLPGFTRVRVQRDPLHLVVRKDATQLLLDQLSEGERGLLVMVADLARRLAIANPTLADPLTGEALVLIDEIELHLHPSWQRTVLSALLRTFPKCQFIVTTHSPQVLSEVPNDAVLLVKDFACYHPAAPTEGRDSNAILWEVLGVTARPAAVAAELDAISELLDARQYDAAHARLDRIAEKLTERDPEVQGLRGALDVVEGLDASAPQEPAE